MRLTLSSYNHSQHKQADKEVTYGNQPKVEACVGEAKDAGQYDDCTKSSDSDSIPITADLGNYFFHKAYFDAARHCIY